MICERPWVECFNNKSSFEWTFSLPINSRNWKGKILDMDEQFLNKGKKYGLFYFENDISGDYKEKRTKKFFNKESYTIGLLQFQNYFKSQEEKHIGDMYLDIPKCTSKGIIIHPEKIRRQWPHTNLRVLEIDNIEGVYLDDIESLTFGLEETLYFTLSSSSNIWWQEVLYSEDNDGNIYKLDSPKNNRPWAYRITPRLNSFLRDLKIKTIELG